MMLPPILDVPAVMARYGIRDRRAARRVIDEAGGFYLAGRLLVRLDDLQAHERALRDVRRPPRPTTTTTRPARRAAQASPPQKAARVPLAPGWWRVEEEG